MTPTLWLALACGLGTGVGLWGIAGRLPALSRPRLAGRLAPYLLDVSAEARRVHRPSDVDPIPVFGVLAAPALDSFQRAFGCMLGGSRGTATRLARAGRPWSVEAYRLRQLLWAVGGAAAGTAVGALAAAQGSPLALLAGPVVGAIAGPLARNRLLAGEGNRRVRRIESELPTVLEFLALSLSAGEGVHDAVRRVAGVGSGELAAVLRGVVGEASVGVPLGSALTRVADELAIPGLTRCFAHIVGAIERGSPLADVLRVQAADARESARRALLESAGRKEIGMLIKLAPGKHRCLKGGYGATVNDAELSEAVDRTRAAVVELRRARDDLRRRVDATSPQGQRLLRDANRRLRDARARLTVLNEEFGRRFGFDLGTPEGYRPKGAEYGDGHPSGT